MKRYVQLNEFVFRVLKPSRDAGAVRVEVENANRDDLPFMKLIAGLIRLWLGRRGR